MSEQTFSPVRIFISGACAGLAEARDALASHKDIELVGTASEPTKAGAKLASTGAQVILHALQRPDHVPAEEIAKIREHTAAPIVLLVTRSTSSLLDEAVEEAVTQLDTMRATEGHHLNADLEMRRALLGGMLEEIADAADQGRLELQARLAARVQELAVEVGADANLIAQEIVRVASRSDISEEMARFRAHLAHWRSLAESPEPCGRKLDFLLQEMNREVNTIGSKADGLRVSNLVISAKAELEKMREQVQNVE